MGNKVKAAIVDDSARFREALKIHLDQDSSLELVGLFESGETFLKYARRHPVDIVIMDARMPGLDGAQTTRKLKRKHAKTKVIICTILEDSEAKFFAEQAGADDYFVKGEPIASLFGKIHKLCLD